MSTTDQITESVVIAVAKLAPPATVSISALMGAPVNEVLVWATLIYTVMMIGHKALHIYRDVTHKGGLQ